MSNRPIPAELDPNQHRLRFDGADYQPARDDVRLTGQIQRVWNCMADGHWRTLKEIARATGDPEASVSAQLRHLRKEKFGSWTVDREHISHGLYKYRLLSPEGLSIRGGYSNLRRMVTR